MNMGLDMYAYKTKNAVADGVEEDKIENKEELAYWRKHNRLHGWFQNKFEEQNPYGDKEFNCERLWLNEGMIDELEQAIEGELLPETCGFFFGSDSYQYDDTEKKELKSYDLEFVKKARKVMKKGECVYYTCWW
tara:strand:+ start:45 stop:446 length:402 start_codon:yes stop_codon:yes gene_type:complete